MAPIASELIEEDDMVTDKSWFPPRLENLEKRECIFQSGKMQGILITLEKSGKNQEILPK